MHNSMVQRKFINNFLGKGDDYSSGRKGDKMSGRRDSTPDVTRITALSSRKEKVRFHYNK